MQYDAILSDIAYTQKIHDHQLYISSSGIAGHSLDLCNLIVCNRHFIDLDLSSFRANAARFEKCEFHNCLIYCGEFIQAIFLNCRFENCTLAKSEIYNSIFHNVDFTGSQFRHSEFLGSKFINASVAHVHIENCLF